MEIAGKKLIAEGDGRRLVQDLPVMILVVLILLAAFTLEFGSSLAHGVVILLVSLSLMKYA